MSWFTLRDHRSFAAGVMFLGVGIAAAIAAQSYEIGTPMRMGAGYFPLLVGSGLCLTGFTLILQAFGADAPKTRIHTGQVKPAVFILSAVVLFGLVLKPFGAAAAIIVLCCVSAFALPKRNWRRTLVIMMLLIPASYLIFVAVTGLNLAFLPPGWGI